MDTEANASLLTADFPDFKPLEKGPRGENLRKQVTGNVRISQGRYRTAEEAKTRRERSLSTPLP